jgi:PAS domain-containing protein
MMGVGEISFLDYATPSNFQSIFGHLRKLASYALLYQVAFIFSIKTPFELVRQTENRLSESEARFRAVIEQSPIGMSFVRGDQTIDVNAAFLKGTSKNSNF